MRTRFIYLMCAAGLMMSCSHEDNLFQEANQPFGDGTLSLNVTLSDFSNSSRVVNEGAVSTFEKDDVVGVLVTTGDGEGAVTYNMPYKYDGEKWSFDISTDARMFSNPTGTEYNYIVYFPYDEKADAVTTVEELKNAFSIEKDQSSEDKYIVSDLMYGTVTTSGTSVDAELSHANSLLSFTPTITLLGIKGITYVTDLKFRTGESEYTPFLMSDGKYRVILPVSDSDSEIVWTYKFDGKTYENSYTIGLQANNRYQISESLGAFGFSLNKAKEGDFLCVNSSGNAFVLPHDKIVLPEEVNCIGIVFQAGKHSADDCNYAELPNGVNGYAMALKDLPDTDTNTKGQVWAKSGHNVATSTSKEKWDGYYNTHKIYDEADDLSNFPLAYKCRNFEVTAPRNSSGWFIPSFAQYKYIMTNLDKFHGYLDNVKGAEHLLPNEWNWTSTTADDNTKAYYVGNQEGSHSKTHHCDTRPILAF